MAFFQPTFTNHVSVVPGLQSDPFITGLQMFITSATTLTVFPGACRAYGNNELMQVQAPLTLNTNVIGIGGCYPFAPSVVAPANNTSFGLYLIGDASGVGGTVGGNAPALVIVTANNFLPPVMEGSNVPAGTNLSQGYNVWRRIGTVYFTAGTDNLIYMQQSGSGIDRDYMMQLAVPAVTAGAATTLTEVNFSAGNLPCNPFYTTELFLQADWTPAAVGNILSMAPTGTATATAPIRVKAAAAAEIITNFNLVPSILGLQVLGYYETTAGGDSLNLYLSGFKESLGLAPV